AIARIFERVNRAGLPLRTFDLMVARTFVEGWNLRERWALARDEHAQLDEFFRDDGMQVVRAIALVTQANVREQAVLGLEPTIVRLDWEETANAMARAVSFVQERCGVLDPAWLPYDAMLVVLTALAREHDLDEHADTLVRWFFARGLGLRFETAANT